MGAGAITSYPNDLPIDQVMVGIKSLPSEIESSVFVHEKFPLVIDLIDQAGIFLKYQIGPYINMDDPVLFNKMNLNRALVSSLQHGRSLTLFCSSLQRFTESDVFDPLLFPQEVLNRNSLYEEEVWKRILKVDLGDPDPDNFFPSQSFILIICTKEDHVPAPLGSLFRVLRLEGKSKSALPSKQGDNSNPQSVGDEDILNVVAELYGSKENIRESIQLVEAAFDGDQETIQHWMDKGYHIESTDGRKHTALSESASQGYYYIVFFLLAQGADPNACSDTGRSPLWRASFNGHIEVIQLLLECGADPDLRDRVSMESAYDVAKTPVIRELLSGWDRSVTASMMEKRKAAIQAKLEERIRTSAERELYAKLKLREDLVAMAASGNLIALQEQLDMIASEVEKEGGRPRATAETSRNQQGQSLLSIATQRDDESMVKYLLTKWKEVDENRLDLFDGEVSKTAQVYKCNPNSRDIKGWTCVCIAVFHDARKSLSLLLEHGGDPSIRSSYNKNAWDLAKDELDAAENVVKSKLEIREILQQYDSSQNSAIFGRIQPKISGAGKAGTLYEDLDANGTAMLMNIEMNQDAQVRAQTEGGNTKGSSTAMKKTGNGNSNKTKDSKGKSKTDSNKPIKKAHR